MTDERPLLAVHDLYVHFPSPGGAVRAVDGVSLELRAGETLALPILKLNCSRWRLSMLVKNRTSNGRFANSIYVKPAAFHSAVEPL